MSTPKMKAPTIDLGGLQSTFNKTKAEFERTTRELIRAENAHEKAKGKYSEARIALAAATKAVLQ